MLRPQTSHLFNLSTTYLLGLGVEDDGEREDLAPILEGRRKRPPVFVELVCLQSDGGRCVVPGIAQPLSDRHDARNVSKHILKQWRKKEA